MEQEGAREGSIKTLALHASLFSLLANTPHWSKNWKPEGKLRQSLQVQSKMQKDIEGIWMGTGSYLAQEAAATV